MLSEPIDSAAWRRPWLWFQTLRLSREYWTFFAAAFFFDAGFAVYFFLFNLFLLDQQWNEQRIGWVGGAFTAGTLLGTLAAGALVRRHGTRRMLLLCFTAAPVLGVLRALWMWHPAATGTAFLMGMAMSLWGVCLLPTVAGATTEANRAQAYSLIFSVSIGTSALGGVLCSALPRWLQQAGVALSPLEVKRSILLGSCILALLGLVPILRLPSQTPVAPTGPGEQTGPVRSWRHATPFLLRYLPVVALWSGCIAAFAPFANIYLTRQLHLPLQRIALIFSLVQVVQFSMGLLLPLVLRVFGLRDGIALTQAVTALLLASLTVIHAPLLAIAVYLAFAAAQWMSSPALYNLLMNSTAEAERGTAAAATMFCGAVVSTISTVLAGNALARFGYPRTMLAIAAIAFGVSVLFRLLVRPPLSEEASAQASWQALEKTPGSLEHVA